MDVVLADVIVVFHFFYVAFCIVGELAILIGAFRKWNWVRNIAFRIVHLCAVVLVAVEAIVGVLCPLTVWEYDLRQSAGQTYDASMSFVARIVRSIIFYDFPAWFFTSLYIGFGVLVVLTLVLVRPRRKRKTRQRYP